MLKECKRVADIFIAGAEPSNITGLDWLIQLIGYNSEYGGLETYRFNPKKITKTMLDCGFSEVNYIKNMTAHPNIFPFVIVKNCKWFVNVYYAIVNAMNATICPLRHNLTIVAK